MASLSEHEYLWQLYCLYSHTHAVRDPRNTYANLMQPGLFTQYFAIGVDRAVKNGEKVDHNKIAIELADPNVNYSSHPNMARGAMDIYLDEEGDRPYICEWWTM